MDESETIYHLTSLDTLFSYMRHAWKFIAEAKKCNDFPAFNQAFSKLDCAKEHYRLHLSALREQGYTVKLRRSQGKHIAYKREEQSAK